MLPLPDGSPKIFCDRREFLRVGGGLAVAGLTLPKLVSPNSALAASPAVGGAKSCILVYLLGGPPHQDMFDLKPEAPAEIRGPFQPIATNAPGVQICEHLPHLSRVADRFAIVRSVHQRNNNHTPMIYYTLTGYHTAQPTRDNNLLPPQRTDFPHMGAVLSQFKPSSAALPGYIAMPEVAVRSSTEGQYKRARLPLRGGGAGFLGPRHEPLSVNGVAGTLQAVPSLALPEGVPADRFQRRSALLSLLDRGGSSTPSTDEFAEIRQRAVALTGSANRGALDTFSLDAESAKLRDRYGRHRFGRSMILARRLTEAGVPMVAIHFNEMTVCDGWDLHSKNFEALKGELLPMLDQSLSALLEDLQQRGRLDETLVVCMGEFGRTPKINKKGGRDHWGECSSTVLFGGGVRGGQVIGSSDKNAAFPETDPVEPSDIQATMYHCLGLNPGQLMLDLSQRVWPLSTGKVIEALV